MRLKSVLMGAASLLVAANAHAQTIPFTFANQSGNVSAQTLDTNFSFLLNYLKPNGNLFTGTNTWNGPNTFTSPLTYTATGALNSRNAQDRASDWLNVLDYGVKGDGTTDDAPAIRAIFASASGRTVFFPPNRTYKLGSIVASGYPAVDPTAIRVTGLSNFHVIAYGATFTIIAAPGGSGNPIGSWQFDSDTDWTWDGGTIVGNRAGLNAGDESTGMTILNDQRFRISDVTFTGLGGTGSAFAGDWNVSGTLSDLKMNGVGICFDTAFSKNLTISNVVAYGADTNGNTGTGQVGQKCYSNIYDVPLASSNLTGVSYTDTDGVRVTGLEAYNFATAVAISSGAHYRFSGNNLHDNPGVSSSAGIGYLIYYTNGGVSTSVGHPVTGVVISGDTVSNNGAAVSGEGVMIDASQIANSDSIDSVSVSNTLLDNNASNGISVNGSKVTNLVLSQSNTFRGSNQTTPVTLNALNIAQQITVDQNGGFTLNHLQGKTGDGCVAMNNPSPISGTTAYNWAYCFSDANGGTYLHDVKNNTFPGWSVSPGATAKFTYSGANITYGSFSIDGSANVGVNSLVGTGTAPTTNTGTCTTVTSLTGNSMGGAFQTTASCATSTTLKFVFAKAAPNGYGCTVQDLSTATVVTRQTAFSTNSCTVTISGAATGTADTIALNGVTLF